MRSDGHRPCGHAVGRLPPRSPAPIRALEAPRVPPPGTLGRWRRSRPRSARSARTSWTLPTPCADWNVRNLLDHVVGEARWAAELVGGATIAEVGDRLAGDLLGSDPAAAWAEARDAALDALARVPDIGTATVELSFGVTPLIEYLHQLTADYLVHAWDLATAIGADDRVRS